MMALRSMDFRRVICLLKAVQSSPLSLVLPFARHANPWTDGQDVIDPKPQVTLSSAGKERS
jgi:hypothetical protein